jgi:oligopeptide transport system substrate-binding protein
VYEERPGGSGLGPCPALGRAGLGRSVTRQKAWWATTGPAGLLPRAAQKWSISKDGLSYEFSLRPQRHWSDGVPLEASHFKLAIDRARDPVTGARLVELLKPVESIEAPDPLRLVVRLKQKAPHLIQVLALPIGAPLRKDVLDLNAGKWPIVAPSASRYFIESRRGEQSRRLALNPHYGEDLPSGAPRGVELVMVSDELTAAGLFDHGRVDLLTRIAQADQDRFKKSGQLREDPFWATYYLGFNTRKPKLSSAAVRCALASLIRRDEVVSALRTSDRPATGWIPPGIEGYLELVPRMDGGPSVPAGLSLSGAFDANPRNQLVMEKIQADWRRAGVELSLSSMDWKSYLR